MPLIGVRRREPRNGAGPLTASRTKGMEFLPALTSGQVELLDVERMKQQFAGLQRRTSGAGRESVDHAIGAHDDLSNAAAGALCKVSITLHDRRCSPTVTEREYFWPLRHQA